MWPPWVAAALSERGHDVEAAVARKDLSGQPDAVLFSRAQTEGRAIVTDDVADFRPLARWALERDGTHAGLVFTSDRRWSRHRQQTFRRLVHALDELLTSHPADGALADREIWL